MSDSEAVALIVAGDPAGLAAAYDKYAGDLFGYCQSLLRDPNDAADAVQDTFVIAASKLGGLRDRQRLRAWLFAVARNECLHRLKARNAAAPLQDAPEQADDSVDVGGAAERAEAVALIRAAVGGLNDGERDVINQLWHGLDVPEAAAVLGVSRNHAYTLFSRARDQLEASVAVLLVGRAGRRDCATLDSLLGDWDGRLTALLRKRVGRHIDRCDVCSDRRRRELSPSLLYSLTSGPLLAMAGLRKLAALSAAHPGGPLSGVRDAVLRLAADPAARAAHSQAAGLSGHAFGMNGFPKAPYHGYLGLAQPAHLPLSVAGGTAITAAAAVVVVTTVVPHQHPEHRLPSGGATPAAAPVGVAGGRAPDSGPGGPAAVPVRRRGAAAPRLNASGKPTAMATSPAPTSLASAAAAPASLPASPTSLVTATVTGVPVTVTLTPEATATGALSPGTLTVSPTTVLLTPLLGGSLTLTAGGGPVSWSISEPASLLGKLAVTPASGTLAAGASVTVTITVSGLLSLSTQLLVQPGGQPVTVVLGLG